jgi:hypothetical protein
VVDALGGRCAIAGLAVTTSTRRDPVASNAWQLVLGRISRPSMAWSA